MNPRLAFVALLALITVLIFIGWLITTRRRRMKGTIIQQHRQIKRYMVLVMEVQNIAHNAQDIDPSAALIDLKITQFYKKEIQ